MHVEYMQGKFKAGVHLQDALADMLVLFEAMLRGEPTLGDEAQNMLEQFKASIKAMATRYKTC